MRNFVFLIIVGLAFLFFVCCSAATVDASQYGTNFKYSNLTQMKDDGWTLTRESGISLPPGGGIILDGRGGACSIGMYNDVPKGIYDWKIEVIGVWLGGAGNSLIDATINTERHTYTWAVNGATGEFTFIRDGTKIASTVTELFGTAPYQQQANTPVQLDMERYGSSIIFYVNSQQKRTYIEPDTTKSGVTGFSISSPSDSAVKYTYAGAYVPEPDSSGPINPVPEPIGTNPTPPPVTEPNPQSPTAPIAPPPIPPFATPPLPPTDPADPTPDYPTGPVQTPNPPPQTPPTVLVIMVNPGTFSVNTEPAEINDGAQAEAEHFIVNGIPSAFVSDPQIMEFCAQEQALYEAGEIAPETHDGDFQPFGGHSVGYYVTVNTHVSGDLYNYNAAGAAVAIITAQVTDINGKVVYEARITATSSQGKTLDQLHMQAAQGITDYLKGVMNQNK